MERKMRTLKISLLVFILSINVYTQNYWTPLPEMENIQINSIAINTNDIILASGPFGTYRSSDNGEQWTKVREGYVGNDNYVLSIKKDNNFIFLGTKGQGVIRSTNNGDDWENINNGFPWQFVDAICVNPNGDIYLSGIGGIYKSTNNGDLWTSIGLFNQNHRSLFSSKDGHIYVGITKVDSSEAVVYRSTDNGLNWEKSDYGIDIQTVLCVNENINGDLYAGGYETIFRSTDKGMNWQRTNLSNINSGIYDLKTNDIGHIFAADWGGGVLRSNDDGQNWDEINSGLSNLTIKTLAINNSGFVFAGSFQNGIYRSSQSTTSILDDNNLVFNSYDLFQNYPNPFNPVTSLQYAISSRQFVTLKVYDLLGREVATLVNEEKPAGEYEVEFNATNLPSGIYFYQLKAGDFSETKKMILLK
jgi:photosystem II stability/assembly factor-like uncharacterized protein